MPVGLLGGFSPQPMRVPLTIGLLLTGTSAGAVAVANYDRVAEDFSRAAGDLTSEVLREYSLPPARVVSVTGFAELGRLAEVRLLLEARSGREVAMGEAIVTIRTPLESLDLVPGAGLGPLSNAEALRDLDGSMAGLVLNEGDLAAARLDLRNLGGEIGPSETFSITLRWVGENPVELALETPGSLLQAIIPLDD